MAFLQRTPTLTPAQAAAKSATDTAKTQFSMLLNGWRQSMLAVWKAADPQAVIDIWGDGAKNVFAASSLTGQYLAAFSEQAFSVDDHQANLAQIAAVAALAKPTTIHDDGTVTVNPPPATAQEPAPAS